MHDVHEKKNMIKNREVLLYNYERKYLRRKALLLAI